MYVMLCFGVIVVLPSRFNISHLAEGKTRFYIL